MSSEAAVPKFPRQLVYNACHLFCLLLTREEQNELRAGILPRLRRGRRGDPRTDEVLRQLKHELFSTKGAEAKAAALTKKQLNTLFHRHLVKYALLGCNMHGRRSKVPPTISAEDEEAAAVILGEPVLYDGQLHYFRSVAEASAAPPSWVGLFATSRDTQEAEP